MLKFTEPLEAKVPEDIWKIFPFKGKDSLGFYMKVSLKRIKISRGDSPGQPFLLFVWKGQTCK